MPEGTGSFNERLQDKSIYQLGEIRTELLEESVRDDAEFVRITQALARLEERRIVRATQINVIDDLIRVRSLT